MTTEAAADATMANACESANETGHGKRKAEGELERAAKRSSLLENDGEAVPDEADSEDAGNKPLSKSQLKRLRRQQQWEANKEDRKAKRKDKRHERQARKRAAREAKTAEAEAAGVDPATVLQQKEPWKYRPVPVSFVIDCDFEQYMREPEIVSLSSQIVRSYAMNRKSKFQASLHISSWKGKLKHRFETVLKDAHLHWKNVSFHEGNFLEAAKHAQEQMTGPHGGEMIDLMKPVQVGQDQAQNCGGERTRPSVEPEPQRSDLDPSVVYLTSESPYTLDRLEANTSYIIGGLVDRNREKGLCYKRAVENKVRTAKLPIGEYMAMQSRYVLTTNQVVEIMVKWLECGDWAKAFMDVIPKRKGGTLKNGENGDSESRDKDGTDEDDGEDDAATEAEKAAPEAEGPSEQHEITSSPAQSAAPQQATCR